MSRPKPFETEAELVAKFCELLPADGRAAREWTPYHETAGWDLLLVHQPTGTQLGIEAKLALNAKVLDQALPGRWVEDEGPDFRAVLVPTIGLQHHLQSLARHVGITIFSLSAEESWRRGAHFRFSPSLPDPASANGQEGWPNWFPAKRCALPEYVPDVSGGHACPVALTSWKIKAIKLLILLERRGYVTRADMRALQISPTRWTCHYLGFLTLHPEGGYVRNDRTPDLKAQHPTNWTQIEADFETWAKALPAPAVLGRGAA